MNDAWDVAKDCEEDVDEKVSATAPFEEYTQRRKEDCEAITS